MHRVHLIFDYVELDFALPRRVLLRPGERVHQTRRSIDLASDQGKRQTPSFIIIGSQKCGTTSLYEYLCHHPLVVPGGRRETHFFDWRWNKELKSTTNQRNFYMNFFDKSTIDKNPSLVTGESTPSYLLHSDIVIPRMQAICPWTKVLIILRNPVDRAYSQYQMCVDLSGTPAQLKTRGLSEYINKTFDQVIDDEINYLLSLGITPTSSYEDFKRLILPTRPLTHGGHSILIRGLYALQLEPWLLVSTLSRVSHTVDSTSVPASTSVHLSISVSKSSDGYGNRSSSSSSSSDSSSDDNESGGESSYTRVIENSSDIKNIRFDMKLMSISDLKGSLAKVQSTMDDVYEFVGLPSHELTTQDVTAKNTRDYIPMSPAVRARLEEFYEPYNQRLRSLLSEYGLELGSSW